MSITDPTTDHIENARLAAVRFGFNPIPLAPGTKRPVGVGWPSSTPETSQDRFSAARSTFPGDNPLNIGLALQNGLIDIDCDHYRAVQLARRMLPATKMRHGRPTSRLSHWWYQVDEDHIGAVKQYKLPDGQVIIEYRSTGGQTMIPPSVNSERQETMIWEGDAFGGEEGPAHINSLELHGYVAIIALLVTVAERWPRKGGRHEAYLALVGGLLRDADSNGVARCHPWWDAQIQTVIELLVHLTHDEDGVSSRIAESVYSTRKKIAAGKKVFGWPTLARVLGDDGEDYVARIREIATDLETLTETPRNRINARQRDEDEWYEPPGDLVAEPSLHIVPDPQNASESVGTDSYAQSDDTSNEGQDGATDADADADSALPVDERGTWAIIKSHDQWLDGEFNLIKPVMPGVFFRSDGLGMFYPGRINMLYGPSESGKSFIALSAIISVIKAGGKALMIDLENGYDEIHGRLQDLGLPQGQYSEGWAYIEAEQPLASLQRDSYGQESYSPTGRANRAKFKADLAAYDPDIILLDGTTTLFTMHGLDPNKATGVDTITTWLRTLCDHGRRTVILLDHTNKHPKVGDLPTGSQHKKSMVQGTMLQIHGASPERGQTSETFLYVVKDRPGKVKRGGHKDSEGVRGADVVFRGADDGSLIVEVNAPDPEAAILDLSGVSERAGRPKADRTGDNQAVLAVFTKAGVGTCLSRADIQNSLPSTVSEARVRGALKNLIADGTVTSTGAGPRTSYIFVGS